jgi:hypothetical protein
MRTSRWMTEATETHLEYVPGSFIVFSTATVVTRTRLNVTLTTHRFSCLLLSSSTSTSTRTVTGNAHTFPAFPNHLVTVYIKEETSK